MIVKVCGLKHLNNIIDLNPMKVNFIGINFYEDSARCVDHTKAFEFSNYKTHKKVGVFVNASFQYVKDMATIYKLDYVQLHGDESPDFVYSLSEITNVIKVFRIKEASDLDLALYYEGCKYFLFDTRSKEYGGSGLQFDWKILENYYFSTPFLLAGGIGPNDYSEILKINNPAFAGIDINSKFEVEPGLKDIKTIRTFLDNLFV